MARKVTVKRRGAESGDSGSAGINKSQEIKDALAADPDAMPKDIADRLNARGVNVTAGYVSTIKTNMKAKQGRKKKGGRPKRVQAEAPASRPAASRSLSYDDLRKAKAMSDQLGGVDQARQALEALAQLNS